jgi:flagellar P-ring protein precursor FlgI
MLHGTPTIPITLICLLLAAEPAHAVKVGDITRLNGQRTNVLAGLGLVIGLKGSGDGGDYSAVINPLRKMLSEFADPVTVRELAASQNVAVVMVTATLPPAGVRDGDKLDAHVMSFGGAASLKGGRLFLCPMKGPTPGSGIFAMAEGAITIEDASNPLHGVVKAGVVMEANLPMQVIDEAGRIQLILEDPAASWTTASMIAKVINEAEGNGETLAFAVDSKNVVVIIPKSERERPDRFISDVQRLEVRVLPTEARVVINAKTGFIGMTGDVEISPVVISFKGLTISMINPPPVPTPRNPITTDRRAVALDTTSQGGSKLQELVQAMDMINVPAEDRIAIVRELYKTGKLHAKLEEQ